MKCFICGTGEVPYFASVLWCDACIEECLASPESMDEFIARKKAART